MKKLTLSSRLAYSVPVKTGTVEVGGKTHINYTPIPPRGRVTIDIDITDDDLKKYTDELPKGITVVNGGV